MNNIICFIKEFEGIIGAVLGSVGTLIVTDILKRKGKLKIYLMASNGNFKYNVMGSILNWRESEEDDFYCYDHNIELNLYNSCDSPKFIRDLKINIYNNNDLLFVKEMKDEDTRVITPGRYSSCKINNAKMYNIEPKIVIDLNLSFYLSEEEYRKIDNDKKVKFEISYINDKNKVKRIEVYNDYLKEPDIEKKEKKN